MAPVKFKSQLEASSYHAPGGGELYKPLREKIVSEALAQGYDEATMMEHGVVWADDQDPWGHIMNAGFPHYTSACNFRLFESFEEHLKDKFQDLMKVRGIGVIVKTTTLDIKRPVSYPDSVCTDRNNPKFAADHLPDHRRQQDRRGQARSIPCYNYYVVFEATSPCGLIQRMGCLLRLLQRKACESGPGRRCIRKSPRSTC